jgi:hypothetical protein
MWTLAFGHYEDRTPMHEWRRSRKAGGGNDSKSKIPTRNSPIKHLLNFSL